MARKKQTKKVKEKINKDLEKTVELLVDEIERTNHFKKIEEDLEENYNAVEDKENEIKEEVETDSSEEDVKNIFDGVEQIQVDSDDVEKIYKTEELIVDNIKELEKEDNILEEDKAVEEVVEKKERPKKKEKDLSETNLYNFEFDDNRLEQEESLDTSFLEGRINNTKSTSKEKDKRKRKKVDKELYSSSNNVFKISAIVVVLLLIVISFATLAQVNLIRFENNKAEPKKSEEKVNKEEKLELVDENYLFVGDTLTLDYKLDDYFEDLFVVNSSVRDNTTGHLLNNLEDLVYKYNPSKIFIQIGAYDYILEESKDNIINNINKIIKNIKENRSCAEIYVESLYPINDSDNEKVDLEEINNLNNKDIREINALIKTICQKNNVHYIDIYNVLYSVDDDGLKLEYTTDGFHLNEKGYKVITNKLKKYL